LAFGAKTAKPLFGGSIPPRASNLVLCRLLAGRPFLVTGPSTCLRRLAVLAALALLSSLAVAQGGPPMRTDDPGTPGNGNVELNVAVAVARATTERSFDAPVVDLNYGVGERIQLNFQIPYEVQGTDRAATKTGLGNSSAAIKWRFFESKSLELQISTYPRLDFNNPTASVRRGIADRGVRFLAPLEVTKKAGPIDVNGEGGYAFNQYGSNEYIAGLVVGREVTKKFEVMAEWYSTGTTDGTERDMTLGGGSRYRLGRHVLLLVMAARGAGRSSADEPYFVGYGGLQFSFAARRDAKANKEPNN
jgi:hypothetical protein